MFEVATIISVKFPAMGRVVEAVIDSSGRFALHAQGLLRLFGLCVCGHARY